MQYILPSWTDLRATSYLRFNICRWWESIISMKSIHLILALSFCAVLVSCEKSIDNIDVEPQQVIYDNVDLELQQYFKAYEDAAAERGILVDLSASDITGHIISIGGNGVAGECQYNSNEPNNLTVDRETWDAVGPRLKEYIVFHELGHCERLRKHREVADSTGACISIMASGTGACRERYLPTTREAYLDELFDEAFYGEWP